MPTARGHVVCGVVRGKIYVMGGWVGGTASDACEEYNPATNTWTVRSPMPTPRYTLGAATHNNLIYVIGGMNMSSQVFGNNEVYNPDSNTWTIKAPMPTPRMGGATFLVGNSIYVAGGSNLGSALFVNEGYDIGTDQWQSRAGLAVRRYCVGACSYQSRGYAIGGYDYLTYHTTVEIYDPVAGLRNVDAEWTSINRGRDGPELYLCYRRLEQRCHTSQ
jgi:N-acetylneuraminic acid mutarotase